MKMEEVPNIISTKDFAYISDMFEWNFTACKEIYHFANEVEDESFKDLLMNVASMHQAHCQFLLSILQGDDTSEE